MESECGFSNPPTIKTEYMSTDETQEYVASEVMVQSEGIEDKNAISSVAKYSLPKVEQCADQDKKDGNVRENREYAESSGNTQSPTNGYEMPPANHYLRNAILDEVLSEKKMALLWSPQVIKFLQEQQIAKRTNF